MVLPGVWVTKLVDKFDVDIRILDTLPFGEKGVQDLMEIKITEEQLEPITKFLKEDPAIEDVQLEMVEDNKAIGVVKCKMCFGCRVLISSNCFLVSAQTKKDEGRVEWTVISPDNKCIQDLIEGLKKHKADPQIMKIKTIKEEELLTEKQETIVRTAYERGFYDFPKRIGVKALADMFEVSTATLSEILRRGQKKIIEKYFDEN